MRTRTAGQVGAGGSARRLPGVSGPLLCLLGILLLTLLPAEGGPAQAVGGTWMSTGALGTARTNAAATILFSGKVLVTGGQGTAGALASAELYDPTAGTWSATGSMATARIFASATLLLSGKVLVAGGEDATGTPLKGAELYDPSAGSWSPTGSMLTGRYLHAAALLANGKVLVVGGYYSGAGKAEQYDPSTGTWSAVASPLTAADAPAALVLGSQSGGQAGKLLLVGGYGLTGCCLRNAELLDGTGWHTTGSLVTARAFNTMTYLTSNGKALVAGGRTDQSGTAGVTNSAEVWDPSTGTWSATATTMTAARAYHTATALSGGQVLVAGGVNGCGATGCSALASAELYDPTTNAWTATGSMNTARAGAVAVRLASGPNSGDVLVAGGGGNGTVALASAELYVPPSALSATSRVRAHSTPVHPPCRPTHKTSSRTRCPHR